MSEHEDNLKEQPESEGSNDASQERPHSDARVQRPAPLLRWVYFVVTLLVIPGLLATVTVRLLRPDSPYDATNALQSFVAEQFVPSTILFFTGFALLLWRLRYTLPLASRSGVLGRPDLPRDLCVHYDQAQQLLEETKRLLKNHERAITAALTADEIEDIEAAISQLEATMDAARFSPDAFEEAAEELDEYVCKYLARWRKSELREYGESVGIAFAVALLLRFFVVEAFKIPSGSMVPTLMIGDHIFVAKYAYGPLLPRTDMRILSQMPPDRGDVIVFKFPEKKEQDFIKRVVALPGDRLEVLDGRPVINGVLAPQCYVGRVNLDGTVRGHLYLETLGKHRLLTMYNERQVRIPCKRSRDCGGARACRSGVCGMLQGPFKVRKGEVYVMGDNRNNSHDSRYWRGGMGAGVPFENVKGRAMFVWWAGMDRLFVDVMGDLKIPVGADPKLEKRLAKCLSEAPALQ